MNKLIIVVVLLFSTISVHAQNEDFEAFRKSLTEGYKAHREKVLTDYEDFRQQVNADYAEHMRQVWKDFKAFKAAPVPEDNVNPVKPIPYKKKKPQPTPVPEPVIEKEIPVEPVVPPIFEPEPEPEPQPLPIEPIREKPVVKPQYFTATYCGTEIKLRLTEKEKFNLASISENSLADAWDNLSDSRYDNLLYDCLSYRDTMQLCDWAYLGMLTKVCSSFLGEGSNESVLLTSWLYCQSGYMMRLGASDNKVEMLYGSKHAIYCKPYYKFAGVNFYRLSSRKDDLRIFDYSFKGEKPMSLYINRRQVFTLESSEPRLLVSDAYPEIEVSVAVNKNDLEFYNTYPTSEINGDMMTRWAMYANTPLDNSVMAQFYPLLRTAIYGLSKLEAANRLLNWVQTAFVYGYDDEIWGSDRAFFAEETLFYPFCDCEDRSILFSRLVRDILGLDVILVYYPGHLATAIAFNESVRGDYLIYNNTNYTIADPTYINAPVGETMPSMVHKETKAILLNR